LFKFKPTISKPILNKNKFYLNNKLMYPLYKRYIEDIKSIEI